MVGAGVEVGVSGVDVVGDGGGVGCVGGGGEAGGVLNKDGVEAVDGGAVGETATGAGCGSGTVLLVGEDGAVPARFWTRFIIAAMLFGFSFDFICGLLRSGSRESSVSAPPRPPFCDTPLVKSPSNFWSGLADNVDEDALAGG